MNSSCPALLLFTVFLAQLALTVSQPVFSCFTCVETQGNYTGNSTYSRNLKTLMSNISSNTKITNGFYNFSVGQNSDKINGIALCRRDLSVSDCQTCLNWATRRLPGECPTQKEAIGYYYGKCMLRYSDRLIFGKRESSPNCTQQNGDTIPDSDIEKFNQTLANLFDRLKNQAAEGDSRYKFATGDANVTTSLKIYALTQCNPDLSRSDCSTCLQEGISQLESCCSRSIGASITGPSCTVDFENNLFITLPSSFSPPSAYNRSNSGKQRGTYKTWIIIVLCVLFVPLAILICYFYRRRIRTTKKEGNNPIRGIDSLQFDFEAIQVATEHFSDAKKIGKGRTSTIYKGVLPNGQEIAVKRLCRNHRDNEQEFNNEVTLLANLQHRNLVKLLGFCIVKDLKLLIYEYLRNESLGQFLYDPIKRARLDWETRCKIILGTARGLLYLHEDSHLRVIHRNLKAANILLGVEMNPKISNFSKAKLVHADQTSGDTSTIKGTYEYMPPEFMLDGHFSISSDVFSFGLLVLEIVSGRRISKFSDGENDENLLSFAWEKWSTGAALDVVDETITSIDSHTTQILRCIKIALLCVQENPTSRPAMSAVVFMLNSSTVTLAEPSKPAFLNHSSIDLPSVLGSDDQLNISYQRSVYEASISELQPR